MTISETIAYLEKLKEEHGDIELVFADVCRELNVDELIVDTTTKDNVIALITGY